MFGDWWIDDMGKWRAAELPGAEAESAVPIGPELREQQTAYRQLGLVKASLTPTTITFRWDIWYAAPEAIESMIEFLEVDKQPRRIVLDFFYGGWVTETFYVPSAAISRIQQTTSFRSVELIDTIFVQEQNFDSIDHSSDVIKRGYEYFEKTEHLFDVSDEHAFKSLYSKTLVYAEGESEEFFLRLHVGQNAAIARVTQSSLPYSHAVSSGVVSRPSGRYGKMVSAAYNGVLRKREPRLHHVRALFRRENSEPFWVPYQRLLYPSELSDGTPVFICLSDITEDVNIPFLQPNRPGSFHGSSL